MTILKSRTVINHNLTTRTTSPTTTRQNNILNKITCGIRGLSTSPNLTCRWLSAQIDWLQRLRLIKHNTIT